MGSFLALIALLFASSFTVSISEVLIQLDEVAIEQNGYPECRLRDRSNANNKQNVWLFQGEVLTYTFCLREGRDLGVYDFTYSNDGWEDVISFEIDGYPIGEVLTHDTSNFGELWNNFYREGDIGSIYLPAGKHRLTLNVTMADKYGIEYDELVLDLGDDIIEEDILCPEPADYALDGPRIEYKCGVDEDAPIKVMMTPSPDGSTDEPDGSEPSANREFTTTEANPADGEGTGDSGAETSTSDNGNSYYSTTADDSQTSTDDNGNSEYSTTEPTTDDNGNTEYSTNEPTTDDNGNSEYSTNEPTTDDNGNSEYSTNEPTTDDNGNTEYSTNEPTTDDNGNTEYSTNEPTTDDNGNSEYSTNELTTDGPQTSTDNNGNSEHSTNEPTTDDNGNTEYSTNEPTTDDNGNSEYSTNEPTTDDNGNSEYSTNEPTTDGSQTSTDDNGNSEYSTNEPTTHDTRNSESSTDEPTTDGSQTSTDDNGNSEYSTNKPTTVDNGNSESSTDEPTTDGTQTSSDGNGNSEYSTNEPTTNDTGNSEFSTDRPNTDGSPTSTDEPTTDGSQTSTDEPTTDGSPTSTDEPTTDGSQTSTDEPTTDGSPTSTDEPTTDGSPTSTDTNSEYYTNEPTGDTTHDGSRDSSSSNEGETPSDSSTSSSSSGSSEKSESSSVSMGSPDDVDITIERTSRDLCESDMEQFDVVSSLTTRLTISVTQVITTTVPVHNSFNLTMDNPRVIYNGGQNSFVQAYPGNTGEMWIRMNDRNPVPCSAMQFSAPDSQGNMTSRFLMRNDGSFVFFPEQDLTSQAVFYSPLTGMLSGRPGIGVASVDVTTNGTSFDMMVHTEYGSSQIGVSLGGSSSSITFTSGIRQNNDNRLSSLSVPCANKNGPTQAYVAADGTEYVSMFDDWKSFKGREIELVMGEAEP